MRITRKHVSIMWTVTIFTLLLIATPPINSANSSLQKEVSISSTATVRARTEAFDSGDVVWEDGFEDGDESFPSWDDYYTDSQTSPSHTDISNEQVHGGNKAVKFTYLPDGSEWTRRLGLFIHDDTGSVYQTGFYWSFWYYVPSDIDSWIGSGGFAIGGLKWYFLKVPGYQWSYGARWRLYKSGSTVGVRLYIQGSIWRGYESPQWWGGVLYYYNPPTNREYTSAVTIGGWNHFQIYLKARTDNTGVWQAWVNHNLIATISGEPTHPDAFLSPTPPDIFYSQNNRYPHPQLMMYGQVDDPDGYAYADDCVLATEYVPASYTVDARK